MEGNKVDDDPFTVLPKKAYQALKQARNALNKAVQALLQEHISNIFKIV